MPDRESVEASRKERERERHRLEILKAAERVFIRKGYHAATMEEIAQEAEFAVGTLYNFFKSKDDLYARVIDGIAQNFTKQFKANVLSTDDPEQAIATLIELRLTHFEDHRGFFRVFLEMAPGSHVDPTRAFPEDCAALYERYVGAVTEIFKRGISQHVFDETDPMYLALCLEGVINAFVAYWSKREPTESLSVRVEKMKREFIGRIRWKPRAGESEEAAQPRLKDIDPKVIAPGTG